MKRWIISIALALASMGAIADSVIPDPGFLSLLGGSKTPGARWGICGYTMVVSDFTDMVYQTVESADASAQIYSYWFPRKLGAGVRTFVPVCVSTTSMAGTAVQIVMHRRCPQIPTPECPGTFGPPVGSISVSLRNGYPH